MSVTPIRRAGRTLYLVRIGRVHCAHPDRLAAMRLALALYAPFATIH